MDYTADVNRDGRWWMISVKGVKGVTQARSISEVELMAREFIAVSNDEDLGDVRVDLTIYVDDENVTAVLREISAEREQAAELEADAARLTREIATKMNTAGVSLREVGQVLGVSHQRAHQLVNN